MALSLTEIAAGFLTTLNPLHQHAGGRVKKIEDYQGDLDVESLEQLVVTFPMILIVYGTSDYAEDAYPFMMETQTWAVIIGDRNLRGNAAARKDSPEGVYGLLDAARGLLHGSRLGLSIDKCAIRRNAPLAQTRTLALYSQEYHVVQRVRS